MPSQTKSILKLKRLFVDLNLQGAVENVRRLTGKGQSSSCSFRGRAIPMPVATCREN